MLAGRLEGHGERTGGRLLLRDTGSMTEPRIEDFLRLEAKVWQALADGDPEEDARLLSDDFLGVYPTGFADRSDHTGQLVDGPTIATFALHNARLVAISESAVILSYRADYEHARTTAAGEAESMYVSSLWCQRDGRWVNVFSQDTPTRQ